MLAYEPVGDVEDPPVIDTPLQVLEQVLVPDELHTGRGVVWVGPHLALKRQSEIVRMHVTVEEKKVGVI